MCEKVLVTRSSMPPYEEYIEMIKPLWDSHWITNMGRYHQELERKLKTYLDVQELSLLVNGHMSLEMAIQMMGFPEGAEIITTPFTFVSTTHAIVRNHLKPIFCDVKQSDGTMDESKIERLISKNTVAIIPVHVYGNVCNIEKIQEIANKYNLKVIYDSAHAFGVRYRGKGIGNYGDASIFSFHATKVFNTIEGGAVAFSDKTYYEKLYELKNFGIQDEELITAVGANAKMNEFCAVMGICNLKYIDKIIENRRQRYEYYKKRLNRIQGINLFSENPNVTGNYAYMPVIIEGESGRKRDEVFLKLKKNGIYSRKYFYPLTSDQACFKDEYRGEELKNARDLANKILVLPFSETITFEVIDRIIMLLNIEMRNC